MFQTLVVSIQQLSCTSLVSRHTLCVQVPSQSRAQKKKRNASCALVEFLGLLELQRNVTQRRQHSHKAAAIRCPSSPHFLLREVCCFEVRGGILGWHPYNTLVPVRNQDTIQMVQAYTSAILAPWANASDCVVSDKALVALPSWGHWSALG
eukprot:scaffold771_cov170-Amphora_coffeaeformis.AAC.3